jgi:hypothetical protein
VSSFLVIPATARAAARVFSLLVIPAKAGIQLDLRFARHSGESRNPT